MKKILLLTLALASTSTAMAGGLNLGSVGYTGYPTTRFGVVITGGQASQATTIDTGKLAAGTALTSIGKTNQSSGRLGLQYNLNSRWALDVGAVDFGGSDFTITTSSSAQAVRDATTRRGNDGVYTAGVQYRIPLNRRLDMNLGVGAANWKDKQKITINNVSNEFSDSGTDPYARLGLGYRLNRSTSLIMNSEYYGLDEPVTRWDVGAAFHF